MNEMTLTIPADIRWTVALRSTLSAAGAIAGLSLETIDDMRLAVDEAFDLLIHQPRRLESVHLICHVEEDKLDVRLEGKRSFSPAVRSGRCRNSPLGYWHPGYRHSP